VVERKAAHEPQGSGFLFQDEPNRLAVWAPPEAYPEQALAISLGLKVGCWAYQVHDEPPHVGSLLLRAFSEPKKLYMPSASKRANLR
jgi:hypothetical protein